MNGFPLFILCIAQPLMQWLIGIWSVSMHKHAYLLLKLFLFEEWGGKVQTPDLLVMDSLLPC
jgi:hypothetical protein